MNCHAINCSWEGIWYCVTARVLSAESILILFFSGWKCSLYPPNHPSTSIHECRVQNIDCNKIRKVLKLGNESKEFVINFTEVVTGAYFNLPVTFN